MTSRDERASYYDITLPDGTRTEVWSVLRAVLTAEEALGYAKGCLLTRIMRDGRKDVDRLREAEKVGIEAGMLAEAMEAYINSVDAVADRECERFIAELVDETREAWSIVRNTCAILGFREGEHVVDEAARVAARIAELEREHRRLYEAEAAAGKALSETLTRAANMATAEELEHLARDDIAATNESDAERDRWRQTAERAQSDPDALRKMRETEREDNIAVAEELERVRRELADERGWNDKRRGMYERLGRALDPFREKRYTGEPARDDATEVEAVCRELAALRDRYRPRKQSEEPAPRAPVLEWNPVTEEWFPSHGSTLQGYRTWTHQPPAPEGEA